MSVWGSFILTSFFLGFWAAWRLLYGGRESSLLRLPEEEDLAFKTLWKGLHLLSPAIFLELGHPVSLVIQSYL